MGLEDLRKKFPETFCAMGSWETPGFLSRVAMWTLCYSGRDQADEETPVVSEPTSAMRYHSSPYVLFCSSRMPLPQPQPEAGLKDFTRKIPSNVY